MALKIAILASGSGTNAQSMIDKAAQGVLDIDIRLIAGNRPGAKVFERAEKAGIPHVCIDHKAFADRESFDREMVAAIKASGAEYVVLAGYMRLLTSTFLQAFPGRVINIHPAILPSFPGAHGGPDAQAYGVKITGCTVHFVEELVDSGPVIIQAAVPANAGEELDDLMNRIHPLEHRIYPQALQWLAEGRLHLEGRRMLLSPADRPLAPQPEDANYITLSKTPQTLTFKAFLPDGTEFDTVTITKEGE